MSDTDTPNQQHQRQHPSTPPCGAPGATPEADIAVDGMLALDDERLAVFTETFDPLTGRGSLGDRTLVQIPDFALPQQWIPNTMLAVPFVAKLIEQGSIDAFLRNVMRVEPNPQDAVKVSRHFIWLRFKHDFPFWAASLVRIKNKYGGDDVLFRLRYPQRILVSAFERSRLAGEPIRLVLLKARQWGGSTTTQLYMAWLQFFHRQGLNSLIIAHQGAATDEIRDMFDRMLKSYPVEFLYPPGSQFSPDEPKLVSVGRSGSTHRVPQRNCKIKIGTAQSPDGCRGGDYSLVHLSEVGLWVKTDGKSPEDVVRSACSGVLLRPLTMIVMESTANGTGNFFHQEYTAAADPDTPSQFRALFIPWFFIEQYSLPFASDDERRSFARWLYDNRNATSAPSEREQPGRYLWWLWQSKGATLEAINYYIRERAGKGDHAAMAAEYPSDDIEAFVHSGRMVFDRYLVERFRPACRPPKFTGEVVGRADDGPAAFEDLRFAEDRQGAFCIWNGPEVDDEFDVSDRYLVVVDIGGRSHKSDFSVIVVFDRLDMMDGQPPCVVAQWYGHDDIDRIAWRAARIAAFYNDALLVIESNTLETHDRDRRLEGGDQSQYILNQIAPLYRNLYFRRQSEDEIRQGLPRKYGFHTNVATKPMIISTLVKVVRERLYVERDARCVNEFLDYEQKPNGSYGAITGKHDDLLMTRAIGLHICFYEMQTPRLLPRRRTQPPYNNRPVSEAVL